MTLDASGFDTYSWTGPGGFTSSLPNPKIDNVQTSSAGSYTITALLNGCVSKVSTTVSVNPIPASALSFNFDDYITIPHFALGTEYTIEAMLKNPTKGAPFISWYNTQSFDKYNVLMISMNGQLEWRIRDVSWPYVGYIAGPDVTDGNWHHVAVVKTNSSTNNAFMYVDGVLVAQNLTLTINPATTGINIGKWPSWSSYQGQMDEVRIWNRALCGGEINAHKSYEISSSSNGLVAYYQFNQGFDGENNTGISSLTDAAGGDHGGTFSGFNFTGGTEANFIKASGSGSISTGVANPSPFSLPDLNQVTGNGVAIANSSAAPAASNNTDFGFVDNALSLSKSFVISNKGTGTLSISGTTLSGSDASYYSVSGVSATIPPNSSDTFSITFSPAFSIGEKTALVSINSNDCRNTPFTFTIKGTGVLVLPGASLNFDGSNDVIVLPNITLSNGFTYEAKIRTTASYQGILHRGNNSPQGSSLWIDNGYLVYKEIDGGNNGSGVISSVKVNDGQWHHVAAVKRDTVSNYVSLYIDGENAANGVVNVNYDLNFTMGHIGLADYNNFFKGDIDEVRIWNKPLCEAEIANSINCEVNTSSSGLVAYYRFNQGVANGDNAVITTLTDATSSAYQGTLSGFTKTGSVSNFIAQGGVTSGTSCGSYTPAAVQVSQVGGAVISNSVSDTTNFGFNDINSGVLTKTFRIKNTGAGNLNFNGSPRMAVSGNGFSLYQDVAQTIAPSDSSDFKISFDPSVTGTHSAKATLYSNDCDDNPFTFSIKGEGVGGPPTAAALDFDGTDDYMSVGYFSEPAAMTIEAMVKFTRAGHNPIIAWTGPNSNISVFHFLDGKIYFYRQVDATLQYDYDKSGDTLNDGNWHHVAFVQNGNTSNNLFLYVDGSLKVNYTGTLVPVTNTLSIGAWPGYLPFKGQMDEIRIWKKALCVAEILNNMNAELGGTNPDLIAYYRFNQGQDAGSNPFDTTLTDGSGNGYNGTLSSFALSGTTSNWVAPGGVATGSIAPGYVPAKIIVSGNGVEIANNDNSPSITDSTDFGDVYTSLSKTVTFSISNPSNGSLILTDPALVSVTGTGFSIMTNVNNDSIAPSGTKTFIVKFAPGSAGVVTRTVTIKNTDCDNPVFVFNIRANGVNPVPATTLHFDGTNDQIAIPKTVSGDFTLEFWINTTDTGDACSEAWYCGSGIVDAEVGGIVNDFGTSLNGSKIAFGIGNPDYTIQSISNVNTGNWVHVAATWKQTTGEMNLYINGVLESSGISPGTALRTAPTRITIGSIQTNDRYYKGKVDEVRIWNKVVCSEDLQNYMNCEITGNETGLTAYYQFNEGLAMYNNISNDSLPDVSVNNNDGILSGFALTGSTSNWVGGSVIQSGISCPVSPLISVKGNSVIIASNDTTPSAADFTDFGNIVIDSVFSRTFTIVNNGNHTLLFSGFQNILVNGTGFILITDAPDSIPGGQSANFTIDFKPTAIGQYAGTVTIFSNDCDGSTYTFSIVGVSTPGSALHFDLYDFAEVDSPFYQFNNEITVEGWLNIEATDFGAGFGQATYGVDDMATNVWLMHFANPNTIDFFCNDNGTWRQVTGTISAGWHHVAAVASADKSEFYVDGIVQATGPGISAGIVNNAASVINFGKDVRNGFRFCKAAFDEVRIWNRALCHSEILHNYNAELSMPQNGLVGYYQFNHGQADASNAGITTLADSSGNNAHGTLYGFTLNGSNSNWIAPPGGVVTDSDNGIFFPADIQVYGNNLNIQNNDTTPSITDHTDFGDIASISGNSMSRVFTIKNSGNKTLYLNDSPRVTLTGTNFVLVSDVPDSILPGSFATFKISFTPTIIGIQTGLATINNSDCDDPAFMFYIKANGIAPPQASALHFDGMDDYVEVATPFYQFNNEMTFECWLNAEFAQMGSGIGQATAGTDNMNTNVWLLHFVDKNFIQFFCNDSGTWKDVSMTNFPAGWHHVAAIASVDKLDLYIDGVLQDSRAGISSGIVNNASSVIHFGKDVRYASGRFYQGIFDEVRIWNRALKLSELSNFKDCERTGNPKGLVGYYRFNQGLELSANSLITVLTDSSDYNKPGTLYNFTLNNNKSNWINPGAIVSGNTCAPCVNPDTILSIISCVPYTSPSGTYVWSATGNYSDTLESSLGCDSIITVNLTVNSIATDKIIIAQDTLICGNSGSTNIILVDSDTGIVYTLLNVDNNQIVDGPKNGTGDSLLFTTGALTTSTNLRMEAGIQSSCSAIMDNEITVVLVDKPNSSYVVNDTNLYANAIEISYQWVDCNNGYALLTGETNDKLLTNGTGSYALIAVNDYSCADTSSCFTFIAPQSASALQFDGMNDYVIIPKPILSDFTIEYWMNTSATGSNACSQWYCGSGIVDAEVVNAVNDFGTSLLGAKLAFGIGNPDITINSVSDINTGNWMHVAATWKQTTGEMKLYINGTLEASGVSGTESRTAPDQITIGSMQTGISYFNGKIDEVRIWDRVLNPIEITSRMNCEIHGMLQSLKANYHFNHGDSAAVNTSVTTLADSSGNANNGSLINFQIYGSTSNWIAPGSVMSGVACPPCSSTSNTLNVSSCNTYTSPSGNYVWPASGTYSDTLFAINGCDSIIVVNLIITGNDTTVAATSCNSYSWQTNTYTSSGTYTDTLSCGAIMTLNLTILNPTSSSQSVIACESYNWDNNIYTASGTYVGTMPNIAGCDSMMTLNLTINNSSSSSQSATACDSYLWNGNNYTTSGIYSDTISNAVSCDSVMTLNLTVTPLPNVTLTWGFDTVCVSDDDFDFGTPGNPIGGVYSGIGVFPNSTTYSPSSASTGQHIITYTFTDTNGCTDSVTAQIVVDVCTGIPSITDKKISIVIIPNPNNGKFKLQANKKLKGKIKIYNAIGAVVYESDIHNNTDIDLSKEPAGIYSLRLLSNGRIIYKQKIIME